MTNQANIAAFDAVLREYLAKHIWIDYGQHDNHPGDCEDLATFLAERALVPSALTNAELGRVGSIYGPVAVQAELEKIARGEP